VNMTDTNSEEMMVVAASMYYDDELTHEQIAKKLHMSRVAVTRLLQRARREGIVQVKITKRLPLQYELEQKLQATFGLKDIIVVKGRGSLDATRDAIGQAGAEHLRQSVFPNCRLGVGWSTTVSRMAAFLERPESPMPVVVNELAGRLLGVVNPYSISGQVALMLDAPVEPLSVPVVVQNSRTRDAFLKEPAIAAALEHARQCDIAFVGLGDVGDDCTMVRTGFMTVEQMAELRRRGAVGDILMRFYDDSGRHVPSPLERRVISLSMEDIRRVPYIVAMASGPTKVEAIQGAVRGGLCQCLITDTGTAEQLLERASLVDRKPEP
jgi:DNA-binding transcriptional regulator LsrR (DeoR family)